MRKYILKRSRILKNSSNNVLENPFESEEQLLTFKSVIIRAVKFPFSRDVSKFRIEIKSNV